MRKTFPLGMLDELGLDSDGTYSGKPRRKRVARPFDTTVAASPPVESGSGGERAHAAELFTRLARSLAPTPNDVDDGWTT